MCGTLYSRQLGSNFKVLFHSRLGTFAYRNRRSNQVNTALGIGVEDGRGFLNQLQVRHDVDSPALEAWLAAVRSHLALVQSGYLVPFFIIQGMDIAKFRHLGPAGIRNDDIESAQILDSFLDETNIIFPLPGILLFIV